MANALGITVGNGAGHGLGHAGNAAWAALGPAMVRAQRNATRPPSAAGTAQLYGAGAGLPALLALQPKGSRRWHVYQRGAARQWCHVASGYGGTALTVALGG